MQDQADAIIFVAFTLLIIKGGIDQSLFYAEYQEKIDASFLNPPIEDTMKFRNPITVMRQRLRVTFAKYPEYPQLDKRARRVRRDLVFMILAIILFLPATIILS